MGKALDLKILNTKQSPPRIVKEDKNYKIFKQIEDIEKQHPISTC
jgi:hypothetical protein